MQQSRYELSYKIGIKKNLAFLNDADILEICNIWVNYIEPNFRNFYDDDHAESSSNKEDIDFLENLLTSASSNKIGMNLIEHKLSSKYISDIQALYYLSVDQYQYSENYLLRYTSFQDEGKCNDLEDPIEHLFSKGTFLENLLKSLFFLNQIELAEKIIELYDLEKIFKSIPEARARNFFKHFELMGY